MAWNTINNSQTEDSDFTPYSAELKEGQLLGENKNYRLEKNLGAGGMGEVWLATEIRNRQEIRKVVVKTIRPDRRENQGAQEKALKQFRLIQSLNHTNICPIYVIEHDPACGYLIVMGYADGGSYADWFAEKPKSLTEVCDVLRPIADALDFAHSKGVIHRDVKPENMMFTSDGTPWLIDFGIAANLRSATQATTGQYSSSGTASYMAPEQKTGQLQTAQTDEYSLAMVALEFLAGSLSPLAFSRLAPAVQGVLGKAISEKPAERYTTCRAFIDALSAVTPLPASSVVPKRTVTPPPLPPTPPFLSGIEAIKAAEDTAAEAKRRAAEETLRQRIQTLDKSVTDEYQSGRYAEAIAHLNELLQLKPDHPNAKWLLEQATKKLEIQKKEENQRNAQEEAERKELKRKAHREALRRNWKRIALGALVLIVLLAVFQIRESIREQRLRAEEQNRIEQAITLQKSTAPNGEIRIVKTVDGIEYAFCWCPPGEFMMGSDHYDWEKPVHKVTLTKGFWLLETEVTQEMWQSVMGENPSRFKGDRNPVECVSWDDCQEFCRELSQKLGQRVQLPTEAQWEYACRAGTTGDYAGTLDEMAWYNEYWDSGSTHPVAQKKPNAWGLYDMHGNVWEWCSDYYDSDYYSRSPMSDPENTTASPRRVFRGGGWSGNAGFCRSAFRYRDEPESRYNYLGLRVLLVPSPAE